jgi:hypothetical protein
MYYPDIGLGLMVFELVVMLPDALQLLYIPHMQFLLNAASISMMPRPQHSNIYLWIL